MKGKGVSKTENERGKEKQKRARTSESERDVNGSLVIMGYSSLVGESRKHQKRHVDRVHFPLCATHPLTHTLIYTFGNCTVESPAAILSAHEFNHCNKQLSMFHINTCTHKYSMTAAFRTGCTSQKTKTACVCVTEREREFCVSVLFLGLYSVLSLFLIGELKMCVVR